jgi:hypothetical protein
MCFINVTAFVELLKVLLRGNTIIRDFFLFFFYSVDYFFKAFFTAFFLVFVCVLASLVI